jgi:hypothetical protein
MHRVRACLIALAVLLVAPAWALPGQADALLPVLKEEMASYWPDETPRAWVPALIEQESGWRPTAQLRTAREQGCGLIQITRAYNANGTVRMDALADYKQLDPSLAGWSWQDCAAVRYQLRAGVLKLRSNDVLCRRMGLSDNREVKACAAAIHNGGAGNMAKRIRTCRADDGCDPARWFANLERKCPQSRARMAGYGESLCEINSRYPARVEGRMGKYEKPMHQ